MDEVSEYENNLTTIHVTPEDVRDQISILDTTKAFGCDNLSPVFIKEGIDYICIPLSKIFNKSLLLHKFPTLWKSAQIVPLFKKGNPSLVDNYRPVSLLCILSKIFEKIIFKHMYNHLIDIDIITPYQSGFLPCNSSISQ